MKRFIFTFLLVLVTSFSFAQVPNMNRFPSFDFGKYEVVDSLPLNYIQIHFNKDVDDKNLISLGGGYYLAPIPHPDKMIIRTNAERTKAIVIYNSYAFGRHLEFDIKEDDKRLVLYHQEGVYCGYIYDKKFGVAQYFESRKEFKRFTRFPFFRRPIPRNNVQ